jgi:hypothetical protein
MVSELEVPALGKAISELAIKGRATSSEVSVRIFLWGLDLVFVDSVSNHLVATSKLFAIGPALSELEAVRRASCLDLDYRTHLLSLLLDSLRTFRDDQSLAESIERIDHLSHELLHLTIHGLSPADARGNRYEYSTLTRMLWQSPDAITLLAKILDKPKDFAILPSGPIIAVGFDWLDWQTPPFDPAPAPWADLSPLELPLETVRHPFWGAMAATLDACTGDYEWQSLILRGDALRSFHRTLGNAQAALDSLWRSEFGLYPVDPLVITPSLLGDHTLPLVFTTDGTESSCLPWLRIALDHLRRADIAVESEGSWRLTDRFRTQLMRDDEHMMAFEAIRQRSYRLARAATKFSLATNKEVAAS